MRGAYNPGHFYFVRITNEMLISAFQNEREFIRKRQATGIAAARERGVKFGRPPIKRPSMFSEIRESWERREISAREAARQLKINHMTFLSWVGKNVKVYQDKKVDFFRRIVNTLISIKNHSAAIVPFFQ